MADSVNRIVGTMVDVIEADGDGLISATGYRQLIEGWNGVETDADEIFPRLDLDGDGYLSESEFTELWREFWAGDDPDAPGSLVFGSVRGWPVQ